MTTTQELIAWLPASLRSSPEELHALEGLLGGVARVDTYLGLRRDALRTLHSATEIPDELVRELAVLVGLRPDLEAVAGSTVDELRQLIPLAVQLWRRKGSRGPINDLVVGLTGWAPLIADWWYLQAADGKGPLLYLLPAVSTSLGTTHDYPEHVTDLWITDPPDASIDLDRIATWLDLFRPAGERLNLHRAYWSDGLFGQSGRYELSTAATVEGNRALLQQGTQGAIRPRVASGADAAWTNYRAHVRVTPEVADGKVRLAVYATAPSGYAANYSSAYRLELDVIGKTLSLDRVTSSAGTTIATAIAAPYLELDTTLRVTVDVHTGHVGTTVRVYVEGDLLIDVYDTHVNRKTAGTVVLGYVGPNAGRLAVSGWLVHDLTASPLRVGPNP